VGTNKKHTLCFLGFVFAFLVVLSAEAEADLFGFAALSNNSGQSGAMAAQLSVDVTEYATNQVLFTFRNNGVEPYKVDEPLAGIVTRVFFDDGELLGISQIIESPPAVDFRNPILGGENLPEGANLEPPFETTVGFSAGFSNGRGGVAKGVNPGEALGIVFDLKDSRGLDDVIAAIHRGMTVTDPPWLQDDPAYVTLRIGLQVQNLGEDGEFSDAFVMVPAPGALLLGGMGLGMAFCRCRRH
jgi:hypothetical protein